MSELESNRSVEVSPGGDQRNNDRPEPRDPAENRYEAPATGPEVSTSGVDEATDLTAAHEDETFTVPHEDQASPVYALNRSDYVSIDGDPVAVDIAQRSGQHELQGNNDLGFEGTCGLASMSEMVSDQLGETVTENDVVTYASDNALCATPVDGVPADFQGGTSIDNRDQILREIDGLEVERVERAGLQDLAERVESGDGVLAAVKAGEYSDDPNSIVLAQAEYGTDHVVWVTGIVLDRSGRLEGFTINDTGRPDGAGLILDNDQMSRAWEDRGGRLNVARRSTV